MEFAVGFAGPLALSFVGLRVRRLRCFLPRCPGGGLGVEPGPLGQRPRVEHRLEESGGVATRVLDDRLGRPGGDQVAAADACLRTQVDDPVGRLDHVEVVLDHDHGIAEVGQAMEHVEELADIVEVEPGGRFVKDVQGFARIGPCELGGQLHALGLAAGKRRRRLTEREVAQPDVVERLEDLADPRHVREQFERSGDRHVQHVGDRLAVEPDGQGLGRVPGTAAGVASDPDIGEKVHLDALLSGPFAGFATTAGLVEAESSRPCSPGPWPRGAWRRARGSGRTPPNRLPGSSLAYCPAATGRR